MIKTIFWPITQNHLVYNRAFQPAAHGLHAAREAISCGPLKNQCRIDPILNWWIYETKCLKTLNRNILIQYSTVCVFFVLFCLFVCLFVFFFPSLHFGSGRDLQAEAYLHLYGWLLTCGPSGDSTDSLRPAVDLSWKVLVYMWVISH